MKLKKNRGIDNRTCRIKCSKCGAFISDDKSKGFYMCNKCGETYSL